MSRSSSKAGSGKLVSPLNQAPTPDLSRKVDDCGHGKDDTTPKATSRARDGTTADTPTRTAGFYLKEDVRKLSRDIADIRNVLGKEAGNPSVHQIVISLEQRAQDDKKDLRAIKGTLKVLGERVAEVVEMTKVKTMADTPSSASAPTEPIPSKNEDDKFVQALNEVKERLYTELPVLASKLQDIKDAQEKDKNRVITCKASTSTSSQAAVSPEDISKIMDPKILLDKLDEIRKSCQPPEQGSKDETIRDEVAGLQEVRLLCIILSYVLALLIFLFRI